MDPFILGLDIGYSSVKTTYDRKGSEPETLIIPASAAPRDLMARKITGENASGLIVHVDGESGLRASSRRVFRASSANCTRTTLRAMSIAPCFTPLL
ncbi:MAG: hypothetical protein V6Z86_05065 [Hyphomicrobiales bacterium]